MDSYVYAQYSFRKAKFGPNPTQDKKWRKKSENCKRKRKLEGRAERMRAERMRAE